MRLHRKFALAAACSAVLVITTIGATAGASQAARQSVIPWLTWAKIYAMTPQQVAALQNPLLAQAAPLEAVGSSAMRSIYWGTGLDTPGHAVDLYVTDPSRAAALIAAAKKRDPGLDTGLIRVKRTAYSAATLTAAGSRLLAASNAKRLPFGLYGVGQLDRGASLRLMVPSAAQARKLSGVPLASLGGRSVAEIAGVQLTFEQIRPMLLTRQNDVFPFIGGDFLTLNGGKSQWCSAGISIENSSGRDFLVTANHCFKSGATLYTQSRGTAIGTVHRYNPAYDAELIDTGRSNGAGANADEGESNTPTGGINWYPLTSSVPVIATGEQVCQDGITSYITRNAVPCNMEVTGFVTQKITGMNGPPTDVNLIVTESTNGQPIAAGGDSGAVVFTVTGQSTRGAAGMVSYGWNCNINAQCTRMGFVFWPGIYDAFGFAGRLNPHR